jgi:hypothetical protein
MAMRDVVVRVILGVGALAALPVEAPPAHAEGGFRCGTGRIVRNGETEEDVASKCGNPDAVNSWTETQVETVWEAGHSIERQVVIPYDEWEYDLGPNKLIRYVTFKRGRMIRVTTGERGN